ncbi:MAG: hypothetical protein ACOCYO_09250 [Bacteroidota bacterium]
MGWSLSSELVVSFIGIGGQFESEYAGQPYKEVEHDDVVKKNEKKLKALLKYLNKKGFKISPSDCSQRTILMNNNLRIESKEIYNSAYVIPPDQLDAYLANQKNRVAPHKRFISSVVDILLDEESSKKFKNGFIQKIGGEDHRKLIYDIMKLPTWDKVYLYGNKVLTGDILKSEPNIFKSTYKVPFRDTHRIKVRLVRSKSSLFVKSVLTVGRPVGLDLYNARGKKIYKTEANPNGIVRILPAGSPEPVDVPVFQVEEIVYGNVR